MVALHQDDETPLPEQRRPAAKRSRVRCITSRDIPLPLVSASALVDRMDYADEGCEFAASCLNCPFASCKYDNPDVFKLDAAQRDREIARLRRDHNAPIEALMKTYGLSRSHVYRALREHGVLRRWKKKRARRAKRETGPKA